MIVELSRSISASATVGGRTLRTTSLELKISSPVETNVAPERTNASSLNDAASPAPASITTSKPAALSLVTDSGVTAMRFSPGRVSRGTPIRMTDLQPADYSFQRRQPQRRSTIVFSAEDLLFMHHHRCA